ncbi:peptidase S41 family protein [Gaeumannomyces tritici R3-111a-1]|uniref:Peptidase S41 family protein n=1 Tax=Gaeumannomyces tritici (strain R3-111a-1) TaxID=644352 RepID=J3P652_GAET3|nr:peptidase S41 family protein [Gaeumannomyces tritici R3-111a-1]EJT72125.1 peptidase S41 family protein [Gaeumannomyces tritici R3-111a-1]
MKSSAVALGLLLGTASAVPAPSAGGEPCEKIAPAAAEYIAANPDAPSPRVRARMAWECRYTSEFDFQMAIVELLYTAHDGHFYYRPDALKTFSFRNGMAAGIVSVSRDGQEAPMLYHEGSPVIAASLAYPGPTPTMAYEDGTIKTSENMAILRTGINLTGIRNGEDFDQRWCTPDASLAEMSDVALEPSDKPSPAMPDEPSVTTMYVKPSDKNSPKIKKDLPPPAPTIEGYPYPVVRDDGANITAGYFLNGTGYDKVAVLSVLAFSADSEYEGDYLDNFQQTVERFLAKCKDAGKEKLVINVSSNGGGYVVAGYDQFAQLFPNVTMFQANNIGLTDSMVNIARVGTLVLDKTPNATDVYRSPNERAALSVLENSEIMGNLVPESVYGPDGRDFSTVEDILAPVSLKGDYFSAYQKTPLNDTSSSFNLTGTGSRSNPPPAVFAPEDVVLLTDGTCGSTCTLMAYLLIKQAGVRATVVGGRPRGGVMQSVAGVEGAQVYRMDGVSVLGAAYALTRASRPGSAGGVNAKNASGTGDAQTPRQFLYQAANCRVWYTPRSVMDPDVNWKTAVDATWGDSDGLCVDNSIVPLDETAGPQPMDPLFQLSVERKAADAAGSRASWATGVVAVGAALAVLVI